MIALPPHHHVTVPPCAPIVRGADGPRRHVERGPYVYDAWRVGRGRLIFDGITFRNQSGRTVRVAVRCPR